MIVKKSALLISVLIMFVGKTIAQKGTAIEFPRVSLPVQISRNNKEHLFASYYGINSFSKNERYATILETDVKYKIPGENDTALLGLVDIKTKEFIPLAKTLAWNLQQGCMAHWLATNPDSLIIYNDLRNGKFVSIILNVLTKKELKIIPYPIAAVSPNGKEAISINFARMHITREDYGYAGNGQDPKMNVSFPEDDGIFLVDLETGKAKLIISYQQIKRMVPDVPKDGLEYINHVLFSRDGIKIFWLARATPVMNTVAFTCNTDGSNIQPCFPESWGGSHFDWLNDNELMVTALFEAKQYSHILFDVRNKNYKRLGNGLLDYDGHGSFSPNGKFMVTDTYPTPGLNEQKIFLMDMKTEAVLPLGRYKEPTEFSKGWRCDIHCRWSPKGDIIGFNSTHSGSRQVYIITLSY